MAMKVRNADDKHKGSIKVFVYGSLKRHQCNNIIMRNCNAELLGLDSITGPYTMIDMGAFPGIIEVSGADAVPPETMYGEVWAGDEEMLAVLDTLEGYHGEDMNNFYHRKKIVTDLKPDYRRAWVYMLPEDWAEEADDVVELGCWQPSIRESNHWGAAVVGRVYHASVEPEVVGE